MVFKKFNLLLPAKKKYIEIIDDVNLAHLNNRYKQKMNLRLKITKTIIKMCLFV